MAINACEEAPKSLVPIIYSNYEWFSPGGERPFMLTEPPPQLKCTMRTLRSCALRGRERVDNGHIVKLRVCRLPQGIGTTVEEYIRFLGLINGVDEDGE